MTFKRKLKVARFALKAAPLVLPVAKKVWQHYRKR